jgi:hypothetical protein
VPLKNPVLLAPSSVSEACLRIEAGMRGAKAKGHIVTYPLSAEAVREMYETGRPPVLQSYEFFEVDASEFYKSVATNPDGTDKMPMGNRSPDTGTERFGPVEYGAWLESPQRADGIAAREAQVKTGLFTEQPDDAVNLFDTGAPISEETKASDDKVDEILAALGDLIKGLSN